MWVAKELFKNGDRSRLFDRVRTPGLPCHDWYCYSINYSIFLTLVFAIYSSPSFLALERSAGFCIPKVGPVPAENLGEILDHEIGFRDAGSPDPNSATTSASFGASRLSFSFSLCVFLVSLSSKRNLSIYLCPYHLFVPCPFSCLALPLTRYASEHGPHGSTKELSKKEPKTRYDYEVQNRGKIHDLEHEPRGWKSRNLSKSQLSVLGVAGIHSLLGATVCWTPKGGLSSFLAEFLTLPAWTGCQKGFFWSWRISPVKFSNSGVDIEDVTSFKVCKPSGRYLPCHFLSQVGKEGGGVYWIGHCGVLAALGAHENRRFILNLFDNLSASISFRCLLLVALHRSLWLFHGSRCSPASPKKWRGHPQWDPQVVEWLIA